MKQVRFLEDFQADCLQQKLDRLHITKSVHHLAAQVRKKQKPPSVVSIDSLSKALKGLDVMPPPVYHRFSKVSQVPKTANPYYQSA